MISADFGRTTKKELAPVLVRLVVTIFHTAKQQKTYCSITLWLYDK